ncbi:Dyp-type peroxidase family protein (plasmid) [Ketogulonicigenium robustum]|uniref:Dyp-type peroxidase family protein n=1 Tax=Ketogulonicigenium robustum TaxID=92947 RepID=A0A1W6P3S5_9RHOB|nr:Dyp-type peroxidase [Ketogulonicigenium robustum]ARO16000.1 Dyp-type peroxidase family protein [Ketogulonicigenium robustum]
MSLLDRIRARFDRNKVTLQLDEIQALILRARPEPYVGIHAMLHITDAAGGRALLGELAPHIPSAANWTDDLDAWVGVAISHAGLQALGLPQTMLDTFPIAFRDGMAARAAALRDTGENAPEGWEDAFTDRKCHIALTIYAADDAALAIAKDKAFAALDAAHGVVLVGTHEFGADEHAENPFGFRDSISQPTVRGAGVAPQPGQEDAIAPGEFILGEDSETGAPVAMPEPAILAKNGSYVVLRKYDSRVGAFNDFLKSKTTDPDEQHRLAAKMFGRWRSGAPLSLTPDHDDPALGADPARNNDFDFAGDERGLICPHAAHTRRMNPRGSELSIMTDQNIHRVIRRSSTFGPRWTPDVTSADDTPDARGLFFIFISARAYDTIEFLQQEWINRGNFIDLGTERDPIVGLHPEPGRFTIPADPARKRIDGVTTFNQLRGGEYLFMPSLPALQWIAAAGWQA